MKLIKHIALGAFLALSVFCAISYTTSCTKDACKAVTCLNNGMCSGGTCTCDSGLGGTNCQTIYKLLYANTYLGNAVISYTHFDSTYLDSGYINHTDDSNTLVFSPGTDSPYAQMTLVWNDGPNPMLSTPITLVNSSSTGSTFIIPATKGGPGDTFTLTGNGSVNATNASLNLTAIPVHSTTPTISITLSNCSKH